MSEECSDRFEAHPTIDRLGRERMSELVRVHVTDPGPLRGRRDDAMHGAPIDGLVFIGEQSLLDSNVLDVRGGPFRQQFDEIRISG